jgi:hypothetical protein
MAGALERHETREDENSDSLVYPFPASRHCLSLNLAKVDVTYTPPLLYAFR